MAVIQGPEMSFRAKHVHFAAAIRRFRQPDQSNQYIVPSASSPLTIFCYLYHIGDPQTVELVTVNGR